MRPRFAIVANSAIGRNVLCAGLLAGILSACGRGSTQSTTESPSRTPSQSSSRPSSSRPSTEPSLEAGPSRERLTKRLTTFPRFQEVAEELGVSFTYVNGAAGQSLMVEASGGGAGWLDFDGDGLLDLYLCQGGNPTTQAPEDEPNDQLYRQVEPGRFVCVTAHAAVSERRYSQGVAVADYDDDGFDDIYVSNVGPDTLLKNQGDGTYRDVTLTAGVSDALWSTSAAWGDLDGDGNLDLYVCNYVDYDPYHPIMCYNKSGRPGTCHPKHMQAAPDECYFSRGDGTFAPEAAARGLEGPDGKGLGVVIADLNNDGLPDVYVANDTTPNFLFINQGQGRFIESANVLGCAVSREGLMQASMGVALGDFDHNGWLDLYCTNFTREANTLYKNLGPVGFQDVTGLVGLYTPTLSKLGFGTVMADFNLDGHEDIFITNGHVDDWRERGDDHEMEPMLFSYEGPRFIDCSAAAGEFFKRKLIGRGLAMGDFDNDGDWDLAVVHQNSPVAILRNDSQRGNWLKLRCIAINNRRGLGTRVVLRQGDKSLTQELAGGVSYCSAHEGALIFGLGDDQSPVDLDVRWPDGSRQEIQALSVNREMILRQP
jgi:hypothetical protein